MGKVISKKVLAVFLSAIMTVWGLPLNIFAETTKSIETFASEEETIQVPNDVLLKGRSTSFNSDWKFNKDNESGSQNIDFNDSSWRTLDLPHDWSIESEFTTSGEAESGFLLGGIGWYRKTFKLPESYANKRISIEFGGVYMNATVYVNGTELGTHPYGYTPFAFDITDYLEFGKDNVIAVKVENELPNSRWYSGSGIYRDVDLVVTDNVHVERYGTKVTTPNLETETKAVTVNMSTDVKNDSSSSATVTVKNTVYNSSNEAVSDEVSTKDVAIDKSGSQTVAQTLKVNNPSLWTLDSPTMYYVKTQIVNKDGQVIDEYTTDFGFRYMKFEKDTGFYLNGQKMKLKGVCMHHDQGALGAVANYSAIERQVKKLKAMGCNAIRVTHNPASDQLLEICNKEGMMIVEEAFDGWLDAKNGNRNDYSKYFSQTISADNKIMDGEEGVTWAEFDIKQMVDRGKNNPCIIMWSLGNEVTTNISSSHSKDEYVNCAKNLIKWVEEIDNTRYVTTGNNGTGFANNVSNEAIATADKGVVGLNYGASYSGTKPMYSSETSSAIRSRGVYKYSDGSGTGAKNLKNGYSKSVTKDHQVISYDDCVVSWGSLAWESWNKTITNDNRAGEFVWTGFDYIGEPTPWNGMSTGSVSGSGASPKSSYFGIIDTAGFEKDIYYFYQSQWNDDVHTLHILPCWDEDSIDTTGDNKTVKVVVYTDATSVQLYLNGNAVEIEPKTFADSGSGKYYLTWNVPYEAGTLTAKAYDKDGNEITNTVGRNTVTTSGKPSKLVATVDTDALNSDGTIDADGYDLAYISVDVTDTKGVMDPNASNEITFNVTGDAKIVGVDNGDATDTDPYKPTDSSGNIVASSNTATRNAFNGKALVIVQSTKKTTDGSFTLTASADDLTLSSVKVKTKAVPSDQQENQITEYKISKDYYVYQGITPQLPSTVKATYSDGTTGNVNVTWNSYDETLLQKPNVFKVTGILEGTDINVDVNVHVVGNVVSALNYSTFTKAGIAPTLPEKVKVVLEDGTVSEEFAVTWDDIDESKYANEGKSFTVNGKVTVLNKTYDVTASVNVTDKETANTGAKLSELKVNDTSVNGFYEDINEYTVQVSDVENVEVNAEATNNAAVTVLPKYNDVIRVLVQSEDHKTVNVYSITVERDTPAEKDKITVNAEPSGSYFVVTGWVDPEIQKFVGDYPVEKHGILYLKKSILGDNELTCDTKKRNRVVYSSYKDDGTFVYKFRVYSKTEKYTFRTFVEYKDSQGNTCYLYSKPQTRSISGN